MDENILYTFSNKKSGAVPLTQNVLLISNSYIQADRFIPLRKNNEEEELYQNFQIHTSKLNALSFNESKTHLNQEQTSVSMLNSFMLEALCFNTSSSVNCTSESFSVDRELIRQINKDRILTFNRASKNTNKDKNNLLGQINSIVS